LGALLFAGAGSAYAFTEGRFVTSTLEGCRNDGTPPIVLPNGSGQYICPDAAYTTGNLGKGWNELDLVPHRLTTDLGTQSNATTDYDVYVAGDAITSGRIGWDVVSVPVVNAAKSDPSCSVSAGPQLTLGTAADPFGGGTDTVIYRQLTIHQAKGTTCVFDYYERLALGSHLYPGSSLQSYLAVQEGLSGSKKTISIPVNEILPQELSKDMAASQGSDHVWNLTKEPSPASVNFPNVCDDTAATSKAVTLTVTWERLAAFPGGPITIITNIYAKNPAARTITVNVTDKIYAGNTQTTLLDTANSGDVDVPANTIQKVLTHTFAVMPGDPGYDSTVFNDVATATYIDKVTGVPVPGTTTATASASVQSTGPELNATATIVDVESISSTVLKFSVDSVTSVAGSFFDACMVGGTPYGPLGTKTSDPVCWNSSTQSGSGSVAFGKTIYLDTKAYPLSEKLTDTAGLTGSNLFTTQAGPVDISISSAAKVKLTIEKTLEDFSLVSGEYLALKFTITGGGSTIEKTLIFDGSKAGPQSIELTGLMPDTYTVAESSTAKFYTCNPDNAGCTGVDLFLKPLDPQNIALTPVNGVMLPSSCAATAPFANSLGGSEFPYPKAQVAKVTDPDVIPGWANSPTWDFELVGPSGTVIATKTGVSPNTGSFVDFGVDLTVDQGTYKIREKANAAYDGIWDLTQAVLNKSTGGATTDTTDPIICEFTVSLPNDGEVVWSCTFKNTLRGKVKVVKTVQGQPLTGTQAFTFQLRKDASPTQTGTTLDQQIANAGNNGTVVMPNAAPFLIPGNTYQLCEVVMPGWMTTLGTFVPDSFIPPDGVAPNPNVDNSILCINFTVQPGQIREYTVDNTPPPGGRALTIGFWKNWASCANSKGMQKPVLDQTMAMATPPGIQVDNFYLLGDPLSPDVAPDCSKAVNLLNKSTMLTGKKKASDPLFNMTAQLVAAELNLAAGAYRCGRVLTKVSEANALLTWYGFTGEKYSGKLSPTDASLANSLAMYLDNYNNNRTNLVCP
jgi:hypothetical protein